MKTRDYGTNPPKPATIPNTHRVPPKQWRKWTQAGKIAFNDVYRCMRDNQGLFTHPKAEIIPSRHWSTIAWNAAWYAGDAASNQSTPIGSVYEDIDPATGRVVRSQVVR